VVGISQRDARNYTENMLDPDLEVLSKVLSWVYKSYSEDLLLVDDCKYKHIHLIAPILWSVVQLLPNIKVNVEQDLDGNLNVVLVTLIVLAANQRLEPGSDGNVVWLA